MKIVGKKVTLHLRRAPRLDTYEQRMLDAGFDPSYAEVVSLDGMTPLDRPFFLSVN